MSFEMLGLHKRECKQCGKQFESRTSYAYRIPTRKTGQFTYFCSWKCLRAYEQEHANWKKKKQIAHQLSVGEKEDIYEPAV